MYNTDTKTLTKGKTQKALKRNALRYNEYYNTQAVFDNLFKQSKGGSKFNHLYNLIISSENILLAYRSIKSNKGSRTSGTNKHIIRHLEEMNSESFIKYIRDRLQNYQPQKVRRIEIPKPNGKMRPLGIPCIEDRIIQQAIKQVLEPICEAQFHPHSYGFRPNRSTEHAMAYTYKKIQREHCYFVVDIDIKGFFDNVNHKKLIKQMWTMGIRDKKVICIIQKMLKAEIQGQGIPTKGVPQGGILSPLLSNIVLNELDWWISDQWQTYKTNRTTWSQSGKKYRHLRTSKLKEIYSVRYADDFKIFCKDYKTAIKIFHATKQWLKERLDLDISPEKSKITNLLTHSSEYLGFKLRVRDKNNKKVIKSNMTDKAIKSAIQSIKDQVKYIKKNQNGNSVYVLNQIISGLHNYYKLATHVTIDFSKIDFSLKRYLNIQFRVLKSKTGTKSSEYLKKYNKSGTKTFYVCNTAIYPISYVQTKPPRLFTQTVTNYTKEGRDIIHKDLGYIDKTIFKYLSMNPIKSKSVEYNDNRLSLYSAQKGQCAISKLPLNLDMEVHHILPINKGGDDKYKNLILVTYEIHKLIHATDNLIIQFYLNKQNLTKQMLRKLNVFRKKIGNEIILSA